MRRTGRINRGMCALALAVLAGLYPRARGSDRVTGTGPPPSAARTVGAAAGCLPSHRGYLHARLRDASDLQIDWHDRQMQCGGDVRADRRGIRVTFAGRARGTTHGARAGKAEHHIRFIFGIDAPPKVGVTHNVPAGVTVIFEGEHRLYSTRGPGKCTIDDLQQEPIGAPAAHTLRVRARGFCIGEAAAVGSRGDALLLSTFDFQGRVTTPIPDANQRSGSQ